VDPIVTTLVILAAVMHASWNALLKGTGDGLILVAVISAASAVIGIAGIAFLPLPQPEAWPFIGASALLHTGYKIFLIRAYRYGDLSQAYPIARGTAPVIVLIVTSLFLGEHIGPGNAIAVLVIAAGIGGLALGRRTAASLESRSVSYALGTACFIASYTIVDANGARLAMTPHGYTCWLFAIEGIYFPLLVLYRRGRGSLAAMGNCLKAGSIGGALSTGAYWLVIWALTLGPTAPVAALRETSIVIGALIGVVFLKESMGPRRIVAASIVAAGVILLQV
jgi:drug/metabolite transporter (DMT)-like permease